jgi:hypothetical protein
VLTAIEQCPTAALNGQVERCDSFGHTRVWFNSCRQRQCPRCQSLARADWIADRQADPLDSEHLHVVFTVPKPVTTIAFQNQSVVYELLAHPVAATRRTTPRTPPISAPRLGSSPS